MDGAWVQGQIGSGNPDLTDARFHAKIVKTNKSPSIVGTPLVCVLRVAVTLHGLVDLPEVAFWIGKVRRAQPPGLVGWGSEERDSLCLELLVRGVDILNTSCQNNARSSINLELIGVRA